MEVPSSPSIRNFIPNHRQAWSWPRFWTKNGFKLIDYMHAGTSREYYTNVIKHLRAAIKEKQRGKLATGVLL